MTRSSDFDGTVKHGTKAVQPDMVIYVRRGDASVANAPKVGLIVSRSVGSAVQRHQMSRRLRHAARDVIDQLSPSATLVIRALPSGRDVGTVRLGEQLRAGLRRVEKVSASR